jgi:hypothetical protein
VAVGAASSRAAALVGEELAARAAPISLARERMLPVLPALEELLPGGLRRGATIAVAGSTLLAVALLAGASAAGSWCAAVGLPSLGLAATAEVGVELSRLALVAAPRAEWAAVTAVLFDAMDIVLVRPPGRLRPGDARRLTARARERGTALVVAGPWAEGADVRLSVASSRWEGLEQGHGRLRRRLMEVEVGGRGAAARPRRVRLWAPAPGGGVQAAGPAGAAPVAAAW